MRNLLTCLSALIAPILWDRGVADLNFPLRFAIRDADEVKEFGNLKNAVNIPLGQLRDRLAELPHDRRIVTYCQKGQRGYLAACALHGHGFEDVANLRGGFLQLRLLDDKRVETAMRSG
jgi:rhodanese-related sulfurtransferase